jgi:hypothetical protein
MNSIRLVLAVTLALCVSAPIVRAAPPDAGPATNAELESLLSAIRANRKAVIAVNLGLTDDEAAKFWPVYERYQKEMNAVGDRQLAVIADYTASFPNLQDDKAMKLIEDYLTVEADRVAVRRTYLKDFSASLPGRKVARFYQIENKIDAVLRYELAARIPVVGEGGAPPK